jgi:hypothetical protein
MWRRRRSIGGTKGEEDVVQLPAIDLPLMFQGLQRQLLLRFEMMVKAPLANLCPFANAIHAGATIAAFPNKVRRDFQETLA